MSAQLAEFLAALLRVLLPALLPLIAQAMKDSAEDAAAQKPLRDRLRQRVAKTWGDAASRLSRPVLLLLVILVAAPCLGGCRTRTLYVPDGTPVRVRETIYGARVWVLDKGGLPVKGEIDIPEGWFILPDPGEEDGG